MTNLTIAERVERGASLLDTRFPGWVDQVDLSRLNLESSCNCVLGQRFGDFMVGARRTLLSPETSGVTMSRRTRERLEEHGFLVSPRDDEFIDLPGARKFRIVTHDAEQRIHDEYRDLTHYWAELITNRRAASQLAELEEPVLELV